MDMLNPLIADIDEPESTVALCASVLAFMEESANNAAQGSAYGVSFTQDAMEGQAALLSAIRQTLLQATSA